MAMRLTAVASDPVADEQASIAALISPINARVAYREGKSDARYTARLILGAPSVIATAIYR